MALQAGLRPLLPTTHHLSPLLCRESINGTDSAHLEAAPPTRQCHLQDAAYMRTLALCIERGCARDGGAPVYRSAIEDYWEGHLATGSVGDRSPAMQPIRSYGETLRLAHQDMDVIGRENMLTAVNRQPINQTSLIDEAAWLSSYNGQHSFQEAEFGHGANSLIIAITTCAIPILFSLFRFLPAHSVTASRISVWLDQPFWGHRYRVPVAGNAGIMPTRSQALFIAYILLTNIFLAIFPLHLVQPNYMAPTRAQQIVFVIGDRTGVLAMADLAALFLFSSRNNILLWLTDWSHSTFLLLHRWVAYACIMQAVVHSVLMLVLYDRFHGTHASESQLDYWVWGIVATLAFVLMWPAALPPVRQRAYQIFLSAHQVLAALGLVATFLHIWYLFEYSWGYEIWVYVAGGMWFLDRALRLVRVAANGVRTATVTCVAGSEGHGDGNGDGEYLRVEIEGVAAEGHAYLYFPTLSWRVWEAHPFSVLSSFAGSSSSSSSSSAAAAAASNLPSHVGPSKEIPASSSSATDVEKSAPQTTHRTRSSASSGKDAVPVTTTTTTATATATATGPVRPCTALLMRTLSGATQLLAAKAAGGTITLPVLVESSYHANPAARKLDRCASLVCVAGGVGITAVLPLARRFGGLRTRLVWGMRSDDLLRAAAPELERLSSDRPGIEVETSVGVRLPIAEILRAELLREDEVGDIGIAVCGPPGMADECRRVIGEVVGREKVKRGVVLVDEAFSWSISHRPHEMSTHQQQQLDLPYISQDTSTYYLFLHGLLLHINWGVRYVRLSSSKARGSTLPTPHVGLGMKTHAAHAFVTLEPEGIDSYAAFNILPVDVGHEYPVYRHQRHRPTVRPENIATFISSLPFQGTALLVVKEEQGPKFHPSITMSSPSSPSPRRPRPMQILSLGLPRTGSYSMCLALTKLGYQNVYHGLQAVDSPSDWQHMGRAADALFPSLPSYNGRGMTTETWDELFGPCDAVTDVAGPFAESLLQCYPDAKVVLVLRDFDKWWPSMQTILTAIFGPLANVFRDYLEPLAGNAGTTRQVQKIMGGWMGLPGLGPGDGADVVLASLTEEKGREVYDRHNDLVRRLVPPERLLVYRLGEGWGPLCEFLGKDVPGEPFPHGNEAAAMRRTILNAQLRTFRRAVVGALPYLVGAVALGAGLWLAWDRF
ncbi:hypothetical protein SODALDRAFT_357304 [Sodiomyces alkalinus F11]|uniref:Ferric oxidoreductase domain-containing protein n=1 Tax=Sodiomyces alkalinus (strain CBS 110278 / VKM F-3762 / F11) TaxID=1314773 RepID=A0A3N2Q3C4_SODAK|nr:hypothetical protein SODALDRAFT_357304 [Sodiomyces alkalinus F11]ROT41271.1 hypothetical protein SODALDRAFT_357304 [Sodiomyces alkalinus F11]